jgi:hypothetical protein
MPDALANPQPQPVSPLEALMWMLIIGAIILWLVRHFSKKIPRGKYDKDRQAE